MLGEGRGRCTVAQILILIPLFQWFFIAFEGCRYSCYKGSWFIGTVRGVLTLFKDNQQVETAPCGKSLETFLTYLDKTVRLVKSDNNI